MVVGLGRSPRRDYRIQWEEIDSAPHSQYSSTFQGNVRIPSSLDSDDLESLELDEVGSFSSNRGKDTPNAAMSLTRTRSLSLALSAQQAAVSYTLRRAHSIPLVDSLQVGSGYHLLYPADSDQDSASSLPDILEPRTVSKHVLRQVSEGFLRDEFPSGDFGGPSSYGVDMDSLHSRAVPEVSFLDGTKDSISCYVYIRDCRTGKSVVNHVELRKAMDALRRWTIQVPGNCCLTYRHDGGEVVTLPWPDLEAGAPEEVEEFVDIINRVEGRHIFSTSYERSPYFTKSMMSMSLNTALRNSSSARLLEGSLN